MLNCCVSWILVLCAIVDSFDGDMYNIISLMLLHLHSCWVPYTAMAFIIIMNGVTRQTFIYNGEKTTTTKDLAET